MGLKKFAGVACGPMVFSVDVCLFVFSFLLLFEDLKLNSLTSVFFKPDICFPSTDLFFLGFTVFKTTIR